MSIIIFLVILSALIIVHELGHFLVARYFGIRVDEFGLGYPPRAKKLFSWMGTDFTLNWLPFGGFVKIFGEAPSEEAGASSDNQRPDNFQSKNRGIQASVLIAGVFFNFLFAWLLISIGFMTGVPAPVGGSFPVDDAHTVITLVVPGSPADEGGIKAGDTLTSLSRGANLSNVTDPAVASDFIAESISPLTFTIERGGIAYEKVVTPEEGIIADRPAVGIAMEVMGTVHLPIHQAFWHGLKSTAEFTVLTAKAIVGLISQALVGKADLAAVTGPVGIVGMVSDVRELGFSFLITFTALLSINLTIINLMPFPALDGGRLLFVVIEAITRRPIHPRFFNALNTIGFGLLIFLMILITIHDVRNIF